MVALGSGTARGAMVGLIFAVVATGMAVAMATGTASVPVADMGVATVADMATGAQYLLTAPRKLFDLSPPGFTVAGILLGLVELGLSNRPDGAVIPRLLPASS